MTNMINFIIPVKKNFFEDEIIYTMVKDFEKNVFEGRIKIKDDKSVKQIMFECGQYTNVDKDRDIGYIVCGKSHFTLTDNNEYGIKIVYVDEKDNCVYSESCVFDEKESNVYISVSKCAYIMNEKYDSRLIPRSLTLNYLSTKKLIESKCKFWKTRRIITLRPDDAVEMANMVNNPHKYPFPSVIVRTDNRETIDKINEKLSDYALVFDASDSDFECEFEKLTKKEISIGDNTCFCAMPTGNGQFFDSKEMVENVTAFIYDYYQNYIPFVNREYSKFLMEKHYFDNELASEALETLKQQIEKMKAENIKLKSKAGSPISLPTKITRKENVQYSNNKILIGYGTKEKDFYSNEIRDMVIESLEEYRKKYVQDGTRRADILDDILETNHKSGEVQKKRDELSEVLKHYEGSTPKIQKDFEKLGLSVTRKSNHIKLKLYNDDRYCTTISSTPSDVCTAINSEKSMKKLFF